MPSVTVWNRLEPSPRSESLAEGLQARLRDPFWILARQWQVGEFTGEDAGSPAFVDVRGRFESLGGRPLQGPADTMCHDEGRTPDLAVRVELGQAFETFLSEEGEGGTLSAFRSAFPLDATRLDASDLVVDPADREAAELLLVCSGRVVDGAALVAIASRPDGARALAAVLPAAASPGVRRAVDRLVSWASEVYGVVAETDGVAWQPDLLRSRRRLPGPAGTDLDVLLRPTGRGDVDWFSCDLVAAPAQTPRRSPGPTAPAGTPFRRAVLPARVRFPGMPSARFWEFEHSATDLSQLEPDERDAAKLLVVDFVMLHSDDWFVVPIEQPLGTACHLDAVTVTDVFGETLVIEPPAAGRAPEGSRWAMFAPTTPEGQTAGRLPLVLPGAASASLIGPDIEEVLFARDEASRLVWGLELVVSGAAGTALRGEERNLLQAGRSARDASPASPASPTPQPATERPVYRIQSDVPPHWIPLVPVTDTREGGRWLERASLLSSPTDPAGPREAIEPRGRILRPSSTGPASPAGPAVYRIRDEQVPATGFRVCRVTHRARWTDGSTHVWTARVHRYADTSPTDALRFDRVEGY